MIMLLLLLFTGYFAYCLISRQVSVFVLYLYLGLSLASCIVYSIDKMSAEAGTRRIREDTLHLLALLGGWPGAFLAQQTIRHKFSKASFQAAFLMTVLVNMAGFLVLSFPTSQKALQAFLKLEQPVRVVPENTFSKNTLEENHGIVISPLPARNQ